MRRCLTIIIMTLTVISHAACCRDDERCALADSIGWSLAARQEMRDAIILSDLCNADKGNAMLELADIYAKNAMSLSDTIAQMLPVRLRRLYRSERQAYERWRVWQETVSMNLIGDIWDLWYGGSALGSFQTAHIYRIEEQNLEETLDLFSLLCGSSTQNGIMEDVTLFQLKREADRLLEDIPDVEQRERMEQTVMIDMSTLRMWVSAREEFSKSLPRKVRREYDKLTNRWLLLCQSQYTRRFCDESR